MKRRTKVSLTLLTVALGFGLIARFVVTPFVVFGESMEPTLLPWDLCLMQRVRNYEPRRGEIVMFRTADDPPLYFVKRVIGLPGETVSIARGVTIIDNKELPEPYVEPNPMWDMEPITVPEGKVFVLGDNRDVSLAETLHGPVARRLVLGRLVWHWRWKK